MLTEFLLCLICFLGAILIVRIALAIARQHQANNYFRKVSPKLPVPYECMSLLGGSIRSVLANKRNVILIDQLHKKYGHTYGLTWGDKKWVMTVDLELIKNVIVDEPYVNLDRTELMMPIDELTVDSIATAPAEQWRRLRQAIAPALA